MSEAAPAPTPAQILTQAARSVRSDADVEGLLARMVPKHEGLVWEAVARESSVITPWMMTRLMGHPSAIPCILKNPSCPPAGRADIRAWALRHVVATSALKLPRAKASVAVLETLIDGGEIVPGDAAWARWLHAYRRASGPELDRATLRRHLLPLLLRSGGIPAPAFMDLVTMTVDAEWWEGLTLLAASPEAPDALWVLWLTRAPLTLMRTAFQSLRSHRDRLRSPEVWAALRGHTAQFGAPVIEMLLPDAPVAEIPGLVTELVGRNATRALELLEQHRDLWHGVVAPILMAPLLDTLPVGYRLTVMAVMAHYGGPAGVPEEERLVIPRPKSALRLPRR